MSRTEIQADLVRHGLAPCVAAQSDLTAHQLQRFKDLRAIGLCPAAALTAAGVSWERLQ